MEILVAALQVEVAYVSLATTDLQLELTYVTTYTQFEELFCLCMFKQSEA